MKFANVARILASMLSVLSYVLITSGNSLPGVTLNLAANLLLVPFAWQIAAYDMITLSGVFGIINLSTIFHHVS